MNPRKEFFLQIDWLKGKKSPLVSGVELIDTRNGKKVTIDAGAKSAFEGPCRFAGCDWNSSEIVDGRKCMSFGNGYRIRNGPLMGGTHHNVLLQFTLPDSRFEEMFDVPVYKLRLCYKDVGEGRFAFKTQSICNGNVMEFMPIRNGLLECVGDGRWKVASFEIEPSSIGWYVGPDYQKFVVDQLESLGRNDWFFAQYALRHGMFLDKVNSKPLIMPSYNLDKFAIVGALCAVLVLCGVGVMLKRRFFR